MRPFLATAALLLAACAHERPFGPPPPVRLGPYTELLPRRLTFHTGDDRTPSVREGIVAFSRQTDTERSLYSGLGREACLAFLSAEGGTLRETICPRDRTPVTDTLVDTWYEPVVSPDGSRIAYVWQRGWRFSTLGYRDLYLVVAPRDAVGDTAQLRVLVNHADPVNPDSLRAELATHLTWADEHTVRFLATSYEVDKVKGGGAERVTDTAYVPFALLDLDTRTGVQRVLPNGERIRAYTAAPGGGLWIVRGAALVHLDPVSGDTAYVAAFADSVSDVVAVSGKAVGIVAGGSAIEILDTSTGLITRYDQLPGPVRRLAAAGGRRFIVEMDEGEGEFGRPGDLWLLEIP